MTGIIRTVNNNFVARKQNDHDNYETPAWCVASLLKRHPEIGGTVIEPCCGAGSIVREIQRLRPDIDMKCYELRRDDHIYRGAVRGFDFIRDHSSAYPYADWCVQNPPFKRSTEMLTAALNVVKRGVAVFQRSQWLESKGRYRDIWSRLPLRQAWIFVERVGCFQEGEMTDAKQGGMLCFAWYVFDKNYTGTPCIGWIDDKPDFTYDTRITKQARSCEVQREREDDTHGYATSAV